LSAALADIAYVRGVRGERQDLGADQVVMQNDVGFADQAQGFEGEEFGISGARPDEIDFAFHKNSFRSCVVVRDRYRSKDA